MKLVLLFDPLLKRKTKRSLALTTEQSILIAMRYYATGDHYRTIGDANGLNIATVSRAITQVTGVFFSKCHRFIRMPGVDELSVIKQKFYKVHE